MITLAITGAGNNDGGLITIYKSVRPNHSCCGQNRFLNAVIVVFDGV